PLEYLRVPPCIERGAGDDFLEERRVDMPRARERRERSARRDEPQREQVHVLVAAASRANLLRRVHEFRRVEHYEIEPLAALDERAQLVENVAFDRANAGTTVRRRIGRRLLERVRRALDQHGLARAGRKRGQREAARVRESVEHARAFRVARNALRIVLLVGLSPRLLPAAAREPPRKRPAPMPARLRGRVTRERAATRYEPFLAAGGALRALVDHARPEQR